MQYWIGGGGKKKYNWPVELRHFTCISMGLVFGLVRPYSEASLSREHTGYILKPDVSREHTGYIVKSAVSREHIRYIVKPAVSIQRSHRIYSEASHI